MNEETVTVMSGEYVELLEKIAEKSDNDIIQFIIVLGVFLVILIPSLWIIVRSINKSSRDSRNSDIEEKKTLIAVIERNTEAFSDLKGTVNVGNTAITTMLTNIDSTVTSVRDISSKILTNQKLLTEKVDRVVSDHDQLIDSINKSNEHISIMNDVIDLVEDTNTVVHKHADR